MGIMADRNAHSGRFVFLVLAWAWLVEFQPGCGKALDINRLRQAAELGDAEAKNKLGVMYTKCEGMACFLGRGVAPC